MMPGSVRSPSCCVLNPLAPITSDPSARLNTAPGGAAMPSTLRVGPSVPSPANVVIRRATQSTAMMVSAAPRVISPRRENSPGPSPEPPRWNRNVPCSLNQRSVRSPLLATTSRPSDSGRTPVTPSSRYGSSPSATPMVRTGSGDRCHASGADQTSPACSTISTPALSRTVTPAPPPGVASPHAAAMSTPNAAGRVAMRTRIMCLLRIPPRSGPPLTGTRACASCSSPSADAVHCCLALERKRPTRFSTALSYGQASFPGRSCWRPWASPPGVASPQIGVWETAVRSVPRAWLQRNRGLHNADDTIPWPASKEGIVVRTRGDVPR